jgi:hypothetical protein
MRRLVALVVLAACFWMVSSAPADTGAKILGPSICGSGTQFTILFWPHGHHAFGSDNFPLILPQPHFELYSGGNEAKYSPADFLGSAFALESGRGSAGSFPGCKAFAPKLSIASHSTTSTTDATALVCRLRSPPVHEAVGLVSFDTTPLFGVGYSLIQRPNLRVAYVRLWLNRSRLSYDSSYCHPTVPPR